MPISGNHLARTAKRRNQRLMLQMKHPAGIGVCPAIDARSSTLHIVESVVKMTALNFAHDSLHAIRLYVCVQI